MEKRYTKLKSRLKLLRDRKMTVSKKSSSEREVIKKYSHYNLINGYKDPFLDPISTPTNEKFKIGTSPKELESLYKFDQNLRFIILRYLLPIEERIKHELTQSFYTYHLENTLISKQDKENLHKESEYLRRIYYDLTPIPLHNGKTIDRMGRYNTFVTGVHSEIGRQYGKNDSVTYYIKNHGYLPMWVLMNVLTMGNISKYFTIQVKDIKKETMKSLKIVPRALNQWDDYIINFEKALNAISLFRNVCAHNERLYCYEHSVILKNTFMNYRSKLPPIDQNQVKTHIYSIMFIISLFLNKTDLKSMKSEINRQFETLGNKLTTITIDDIKKLMKLDFDWNHLLIK